ncbi:hypothetical protein Pcinc_004783 [Petrolisthes cinctipes]|uniref:Uncharacterized protein n=1 Tax=Petrolisthes cinctipes TaxID=88211 RepID=A0AAE1L3F1_PETCI|nr:hypothetical protein Pcinc_004783 [Petrolisthes cinctipes]
MEGIPHLPWKASHTCHGRHPTPAMEGIPHLPWKASHTCHGRYLTHAMEGIPHLPWKASHTCHESQQVRAGRRHRVFCPADRTDSAPQPAAGSSQDSGFTELLSY